MINKEIGNIGEALAVKYLKQLGYKNIQCNITNKIGELDIVAYDNDVLVVVEVKTRSSLKFGYPREAVDCKKQNKIRLTTTAYLKAKGLSDMSVRFDVIEIVGDKKDCKITHIKDAF